MPTYIAWFRKASSIRGRGTALKVTAPTASEAWNEAEDQIPPEHIIMDVVPEGGNDRASTGGYQYG